MAIFVFRWYYWHAKTIKNWDTRKAQLAAKKKKQKGMSRKRYCHLHFISCVLEIIISEIAISKRASAKLLIIFKMFRKGY